MSALLSIAQVAAVVADHAGVSVNDLKSARREKQVAAARHIAIYLARALTRHSFPTIGRWFGDRDHTTAQHAARRVASQMTSDPELADHVNGLLLALGALARTGQAKLIQTLDALAVARRLAPADDRALLHASPHEISALAQRVVDAQAALDHAAHLLRGLADPTALRSHEIIAARAAPLAAALEALGVMSLQPEKETA